MYPTYNNNDNLLMWKLCYTPSSNDIVVCDSDVGEEGYIIKRCIATEGDVVTINYDTNTVTVNGNTLNEFYLAETDMDEVMSDYDNYDEGTSIYVYNVPKNKIFVMGDNRNISLDSRNSTVGFIDVDDVEGKIIYNFSK